MKKILSVLFIFILVSASSIQFTLAQCGMCKAVVESNLESGDSAVGAGLNFGILYLMAFPYILLLAGGLIWYRSRKLSDAG